MLQPLHMLEKEAGTRQLSEQAEQLLYSLVVLILLLLWVLTHRSHNRMIGNSCGIETRNSTLQLDGTKRHWLLLHIEPFCCGWGRCYSGTVAGIVVDIVCKGSPHTYGTLKWYNYLGRYKELEVSPVRGWSTLTSWAPTEAFEAGQALISLANPWWSITWLVTWVDRVPVRGCDMWWGRLRISPTSQCEVYSTVRGCPYSFGSSPDIVRLSHKYLKE